LLKEFLGGPYEPVFEPFFAGFEETWY